MCLMSFGAIPFGVFIFLFFVCPRLQSALLLSLFHQG